MNGSYGQAEYQEVFATTTTEKTMSLVKMTLRYLEYFDIISLQILQNG